MDIINTEFAHTYTALASLAMVAVLFFFSANVGKMRGKHGVKLPAMTGEPEFEYALRVHGNSIEQIVLVMPTLWLFSLVVSDVYAGIAGGLWVLSRLLFFKGYMQEPSKRLKGFLSGVIILAVMFFWTLVVLVKDMI